ncbi:MAG: hypothetical protein ACYS1E_16760 [Planctomycetota bacterium]
MRKDYILLDDDLEIMVVPHLGREQKWLTYDEVDEMRKIFQRFPQMLQTYNEMGSWVERMKNAMRKEIGE